MNNDTIAGIIIVVSGIIFAASIYLWYRYKKNDRVAALQTSGMAAAILLTSGALIPQAIRNQSDPDSLRVAFSPFLLALFPVAVILKLPGEFRILHNAKQEEKIMILLQLLGLLMILFMYDVFMVGTPLILLCGSNKTANTFSDGSNRCNTPRRQQMIRDLKQGLSYCLRFIFL